MYAILLKPPGRTEAYIVNESSVKRWIHFFFFSATTTAKLLSLLHCHVLIHLAR